MSIRVLIVDDHAVFRAGLRLLLDKEKDIDVVDESENGFNTLQILKNLQLDVLLLDISMPGMPGTEIAEQALKEHRQLKIVILTMYEDEYYLQELFKIGVRGFVLKKSTGTELLNAIRSVYKGDHYVDPAMAGYMICPYVGRPQTKKTTRLSLLTSREKEICRFLSYGHTNAEIAEKLFISRRTVETHRMNIMNKLGLKSRAELVRFAIDNGILKID